MKDKKREQRVTFWSDMMSGANGGVSSKRVIGSFILMVILVIIVIGTFRDSSAVWLGEAVITMLIGAFALLGIGVFEKRLGGKAPEHYIPEVDEKDNLDDINNADI